MNREKVEGGSGWRQGGREEVNGSREEVEGGRGEVDGEREKLEGRKGWEGESGGRDQRKVKKVERQKEGEGWTELRWRKVWRERAEKLKLVFLRTYRNVRCRICIPPPRGQRRWSG